MHSWFGKFYLIIEKTVTVAFSALIGKVLNASDLVNFYVTIQARKL
jgi:hypothetical protein